MHDPFCHYMSRRKPRLHTLQHCSDTVYLLFFNVYGKSTSSLVLNFLNVPTRRDFLSNRSTSTGSFGSPLCNDLFPVSHTYVSFVRECTCQEKRNFHFYFQLHVFCFFVLVETNFFIQDRGERGREGKIIFFLKKKSMSRPCTSCPCHGFHVTMLRDMTDMTRTVRVTSLTCAPLPVPPR